MNILIDFFVMTFLLASVDKMDRRVPALLLLKIHSISIASIFTRFSGSSPSANPVSLNYVRIYVSSEEVLLSNASWANILFDERRKFDLVFYYYASLRLAPFNASF